MFAVSIECGSVGEPKKNVCCGTHMQSWEASKLKLTASLCGAPGTGVSLTLAFFTFIGFLIVCVGDSCLSAAAGAAGG